MSTILENEYIQPKRPYSQNELKENRQKLYRDLRLGKRIAHHRRCEHFYIVKQNSRKEKEMQENGTCDIGNCSVCWKINKTPKHLHDKAAHLINSYNEVFYQDPKYITYNIINLENLFYRWLYENIE